MARLATLYLRRATSFVLRSRGVWQPTPNMSQMA